MVYNDEIEFMCAKVLSRLMQVRSNNLQGGKDLSLAVTKVEKSSRYQSRLTSMIGRNIHF